MNKNLLQKSLLIGIGLFLIVLVWQCKNSHKASDYFNPEVLATHYGGAQFVGSATCIECHADIYESHLQTAHYNSSALGTKDKIKGDFQDGHNTLTIKDADISMIQQDNSFYERMDFKFGNKKMALSKIDIVIGSGVKGQSYLNWNEDKLYQIQTSYYTPTDSWINSPNFSDQSSKRQISDACLKCHVTFAENSDFSGKGNQYNKESLIYGIDCERCHRPAAKHVVYHRANPEDLSPKFMMLSDTLSRERRMEACVQCHSGLRARQVKGNPFSFLAGENLADYSKNYYAGKSNAELDVHGNQYGLLTSSKCFKESPKLDCTTCHDPHKNQRGNTDYFNQKCISCHSEATIECKAPITTTQAMGNNCISCHMPLLPSKAMKVKLAKDSLEIPVYIRTHLIGIYPETSNATK